MISCRVIKLVLLMLLCSSATAKFYFSREQLKQFDIRRRQGNVAPSNAFRPAAIVSTVTVTVSTTSTTTSTTTSQTTASTTITNTVTTNAVPAPPVVQMHTTHIAILPRATPAVYHKLRMRKMRRAGALEERMSGDGDSNAQDAGGDSLGHLDVPMPSSENIAAMKEVRRQRSRDVESRDRLLNDVEGVPVDTMGGLVGVGQSSTTTTSSTESNVNQDVDSANNGLVYVASSDVSTTSTDAVNSEAQPALDLPNDASSGLVNSVSQSTGTTGNPDSSATGPSNSASTSSNESTLSIGVSPLGELDVL